MAQSSKITENARNTFIVQKNWSLWKRPRFFHSAQLTEPVKYCEHPVNLIAENHEDGKKVNSKLLTSIKLYWFQKY